MPRWCTVAAVGMIEELEAAERARARGESVGGGRRRRIGVALMAVGMAMALLASWSSSWHVMYYDVVGVGRAQLKVGLWDIEVCPVRGECEQMARLEFEHKVGPLSRASDADMRGWLEARWQVAMAMFVAAAAAAAVVFCMFAGQPLKVVRLAAIGTFALALVAFALTVRSAFAEPVDFLHLGIAAYVAISGLFAAVVGAGLIGLVKVAGPLPRAIIVR